LAVLEGKPVNEIVNPLLAKHLKAKAKKFQQLDQEVAS
jgi:hypothetical protein